MVWFIWWCCILICRCTQKHIQHNKDEQTQFFRKIYLSLCSKGLLCERWVGDWTELQHIDPPTLLAITAFLSRSPVLRNRVPGVPASTGTWFSFQHLLSNWSDFLSHPGYVIIWHPPTSCKRHNSHSIQPVDSQGYSPDIFDRMHLLFTQVHFSTNSPAGLEVNMQQWLLVQSLTQAVEYIYFDSPQWADMVSQILTDLNCLS